MKEMEDGIFSDEELNNAKLTAITSIKMSEDNQDGIITSYLFNDLDNFPLSEERIKRFNKVSKEDIIRVAKKVKLNTIYLLTGEDK
jgi:predicted Zn-dependent peptidase